MKPIDIFKKIIIVLIWIGIWEVAALTLKQDLLLPDPIRVSVRIFQLMSAHDFWIITAQSLFRIMIGILTAVVIGIILGILTHHSKVLHDFFAPALTVIKITPVASFIILVLIWVGRDTVPAVISALMVLPIVWTNISTGLRNINPSFLELAQVYHLSAATTLRRITLPCVMPYFLAAIETSIGIGWKAGIAAEVLTVPAHSIGKMIYESKLYMETVDLFAWTATVIAISYVLEKMIVSGIRALGQKYTSEVKQHD